jgi:hypothetical protein
VIVLFSDLVGSTTGRAAASQFGFDKAGAPLVGAWVPTETHSDSYRHHWVKVLGLNEKRQHQAVSPWRELDCY